MTTAKDILITARARVAQGWCQGWHSRNAAGIRLYCINDVAATAWCAAGAIWSQCADHTIEDRAFYYLLKALGPTSIADWNDALGRTQTEVLALFDRAIEAAP